MCYRGTYGHCLANFCTFKIKKEIFLPLSWSANSSLSVVCCHFEEICLFRRGESEPVSLVYIFNLNTSNPWSRDSVVGIATSYGLGNRGVEVRAPVGSRTFSSPRCPDRLWGSPNLLSDGYRGLFPRSWSGRGVKLTTHLQLVPRSRKSRSIQPLPHTPSWRSLN
jgi:hypothetical protein